MKVTPAGILFILLEGFFSGTKMLNLFWNRKAMMIELLLSGDDLNDQAVVMKIAAKLWYKRGVA
jgi:hypothetical protein